MNVRRNGFTLVELLAVITIIALLAALVFPVGEQSVQAAEKTVCLGNMSQLGIATGLYLSDNDDVYPETVNYFERYWDEITFGRPRNDDPKKYENMVQALHEYVSDSKIFKCPSDDGLWPTFVTFRPTFWQWNGGTSYVFTEFFNHQSSTDIPTPSDLPWSCEMGQWHVARPWPMGQDHKNFLMFDGHVKFQAGDAPYIPIDQIYPHP